MKKHAFLSIILSLVMIVSTIVFPLGAAEAIDAVAIADVNVTVTMPAAGKHPNYNATLSTDRCVFSPSYLGSANNGKNIKFSLLRNGKSPYIMGENDTFTVGSTYRIEMYLTAISNYSFAPSGMSTFTINGYNAVVDGLTDSLCHIHIDYKVGTGVINRQVGRIYLSVTEPVSRQHPDFSYSLTGVGCTVDEDHFSGKPMKIARLNGDGTQNWMTSNDTYTSLCTYRIEFYLVADSGYVFTDDLHLTRVFINDETADVLDSGDSFYHCYIDYTVSENEGVAIGDLDGDGDVDNTDAVLLKRTVMKWTTGISQIKHPEAGDVDGNNIVNNTDAVILKRHVMGWAAYEKLGPKMEDP